MTRKKKVESKYGDPGCTNDTFGSEADWFNALKDRFPGPGYWEQMKEMEKEGKEYDKKMSRALKNQEKFTKTTMPVEHFDTWLTTKEVTGHYPLCDHTLRKLRNERVIPATFVQNKYLYRKSDMDEYFQANYKCAKENEEEDAA